MLSLSFADNLIHISLVAQGVCGRGLISLSHTHTHTHTHNRTKGLLFGKQTKFSLDMMHWVFIHLAPHYEKLF